MKWSALAVAAALTAAAPASAQTDAFKACDGFAPPTPKADQITQIQSIFGRETWTLLRGPMTWGEAGVAACDSALADPRVAPFWRRQAHLLQAKAIHLLAAGRETEALPMLAASDAVGAPMNDVFFDGSLKLTNRLVRAYAHHRMGNAAAGDAELAEVVRARPYAANLLRLVSRIRVAFETDAVKQRALLAAEVPQAPSVLEILFWNAMLNAEHGTAARYGPQVSFDRPADRAQWRVIGSQQISDADRAELAGATAYALAATGDAAGATARLDAFRAEMDGAKTPLQPTTPGGRIRKSDQRAWEARLHGVRAAEAKLDRWVAAIALRERAGALTLDGLAEALLVSPVRELPVMLDLIGLAKVAGPLEQAAQRQLITDLRARYDAEQRKILGLTLKDLIDDMPKIETAAMRPRFKDTGLQQIMFGDVNGFNVQSEKDSDYLTIRFGSELGSASTVEELGVLGAAMHAAKRGKDSILIDSRLLLKRSWEGGAEGFLGWETRLRFLPVNAAQLPAGVEASRWRLLRVADVRDALLAKYSAPVK
jgi:hypothetical protein